MASATVEARSRFPVWLLAVLLGLVTLALYWPATHSDFVNYDDAAYVTANLHAQAGLSLENLKWAFTNPVDANWLPLTMLSHMLDCQIFGLNPWGHHLTSVLLHVFNTVLVFLLLRSLTGAVWRSMAVAALFGLHPVHVESVAWVAERKDVLSTCFGLLALIFYGRYALSKIGNRQSAIGNYLLALFFFALGLMSKPMLVTWPFVLLLLDYWPLKRLSNFLFSIANWKLLLVEKIPFFVLSGLASVVTFVVQKQGDAVANVVYLPFGTRVGNALISYWLYLAKLFWPTDLAVFYPYPGHWPVGMVLLAGGLLVGLTIFFLQRRRYPFLLMGWVWFIGTLVPVIGLVQVGVQAMADRYTYIPSLGALIMVVWGAYELTRGWRYQVIGLSVVGLVAIILCVAMTRQQLGYWRDSEALFRHTLKVTENNYVAHNSLGVAFSDKGQLDEAIRQYQEALRLKPNFAEALNNLGVALYAEGQIEEAIRQFQEALRFKPDYAEAHNNLGNVLAGKGQLDEAIRQYQEALRLKPNFAKAQNNLGKVLDMKGQADEHRYQEAIRLQPNDAEAHYNLGIALGEKGQMDEAISQFQATLQLKPDDAEVHNKLGTALYLKGETDEAIRQFQEAIRLKPDYADAYNNLGFLWAERGENLDQARAMIEQAVKLDPKNASFLDSMGWVLLKMNRPQEALDFQLKAITLSGTPDASFYEHLGDIYAALKQSDQAAGAWRQSLAIKPDSQIQKKLGELSTH